MTVAFEPSRSNGLSDRAMIFRHVRSAAPGTLFTYDTLTGLLQEGLDRPVERHRVQQAVRSANRDLLSEEQRYLAVVRNAGYKIAKASDHMSLALAEKDSADAKMRKGLDILRGTRLDELDENQRRLHQGQLLIMAGLAQRMTAADEQADRDRKLLHEVIERIDRLEGR